MPESQYSISAVISVASKNASFATWNSGTSLNTVAVLVNDDFSYNTVNVSLSQTTTITGGVVTFEGSLDGVTYFPLQGFTPGTVTGVGPTYTLVANTYATFQFNLTAIPFFQVRLSTVITGTGAVTIGYAADSFVSSISSTAITGTVSVAGTLTHNNAAPVANNIGALTGVASSAAPTYTTGDQVLLSTDLAGNTRVVLNAETTKVIGTVNQGTSPWVVSGTVTANQGTSPWVVSLASTTITGTVAVTQSTSPWVVAGNLTNNNAAPAANNVGVLPAIAETSYATVTYTTGNQVLPVTDLHGALNQDLQAVAGVALGATAVTNFGTAPAATAVPGVNASIYAGTTGLTATGSSLNANITNTVTVSGTVTVNQGTSPWVVSLTSTTITGTVAVTQSTSPWVVAGNKTNNNAAPGATNEGVLPALANAASPAWTEGNQVLESVDLTGRQRMRGTLTNNNAAPAADQLSVLPALANAAAPTWTEGDQVLESVDLKGNQRTALLNWGGTTLGAPANYGTSPGAVIAGSVNAFITNTVPVTLTSTTITGTVAVTQSTSPWITAGNLTNNNAAPNAQNVGVLPAIAETAYATVTYTTGDQVLPVTDLHGALNQDLQAVAGVALGATAVTNFGTAPAAAAVPGVNASIFAGTTALTATGSSLNANITNTVTVSGTVTVNQGTSPWVVAGNLTNNNAAPAANNVGVLAFIAETAYTTVTYTTGDQVLAVTDLHGAVNSDLQAVAGIQLGATAVTAYGTTPAAVNVPGVNAFVTNTVTVAGNKTNNNAAPGATNEGVLPAVANAASPAWTEGNQVAESVDLTGRQRVRGTLTNNNAAPAADQLSVMPALANAAAPTWTEGDQVLESVDLRGNQRTLPSGVYNITEPAPANTTTTPFQQDQAADLLTFPGIQFRVGATWNSGTALNTLQFPTGTATQGQLMGGGAFIVQLDQTTTITGGAVTFQGTYDNINWVTIPTTQVLNPNTFAALTNPYTFVASTNQPFLIVDNGYVAVRANLTSAITGTGTVIPYWATLAGTPVTPISGSVTISNLPNTSRTYVTFFFDNVSGVTTEALLSGQTNKGNTVTAAQTSYTVTAGKTLRIQSISANVVNTTSLAQQFKLRLRQASAGFSASSNIVWGTIIGSQPGSNAVNNAANFDFPDGLEIAAGQIIGFSHINLISANGAITVQMTGYEY